MMLLCLLAMFTSRRHANPTGAHPGGLAGVAGSASSSEDYKHGGSPWRCSGDTNVTGGLNPG